jgi:pimeloyl-ACP methyl ester carboxylesterase
MPATQTQHDAFRRLVDAGRCQLAVVDVGHGDPVVFVHGVFLSSGLWEPVISALPPGRRYIAVDLPGHGHSPVPIDVDPSVPGYAGLIGPLLDQLALDRVHLVANDSGGAIVQRFAAVHADRVASLSLTNCDTEGNIPPPAFMPVVERGRASALGEVVELMRSNGAFARSRRGLGGSLQYPERLTDDDIRRFLDPLAASPETIALLERFVGSFQPSDLDGVTAQLAGLHIPTLLAWGTDDVFFGPAWGHQLATALGSAATIVEIAGGRLFWPMERPGELAELLVPHWDAVSKT